MLALAKHSGQQPNRSRDSFKVGHCSTMTNYKDQPEYLKNKYARKKPEEDRCRIVFNYEQNLVASEPFHNLGVESAATEGGTSEMERNGFGIVYAIVARQVNS